MDITSSLNRRAGAMCALLMMLLASIGWAQMGELTLGERTEPIGAMVGQSRIMRAPWKISRVTVGDPKIADVQMLGVDRMILVGKSPGLTDLSVWSDGDSKVYHYKVEVKIDVERFQKELRKLFPGSDLGLSYTQGVYVLTGTVSTAEQAERVQMLMTQMSDQMKVKFVNLARMPGVQQVQLKVRVAEVNRTAIRALGLNVLKTGDNFFGVLQTGSASGGAINPVSIGPLQGSAASGSTFFGFPNDVQVNPLVTMIAGFPGTNLELFVQALAENQYLKILAEPTLIARSGEPAEFLAGGEYPIPVVQGGQSTAVSITIEYKQYGVGLKFEPTVLGEGNIRMRVAPEVSELSDIGAVEIEGFRVPTLLTRRASTTLDIKSGQTFAIAGLISQSNRTRVSKVPFLGSIPVVGAAFRTVHDEKSNTELLVLVKAELVEPMSLGKEPPLPGTGDQSPSDWELYALGKTYGKGCMASEVDAEWMREHDWDKLRGPGAWAGYDQPRK
ncbi:type II and III secretion system protein family protein [bacterium]|nr:type II and III secretion system protein family protein [bacterium]